MAFVITLTPEETAELERRRAAGGFRSRNDTIRAWLGPLSPRELAAARALDAPTPHFAKAGFGPRPTKPGDRLKKGK